MHNQMSTLQFERKLARAGGHLAGFSTGVLAQSGLGRFVNPIVTSPHFALRDAELMWPGSGDGIP
jgi:hypothetical protein